MAPPPGTLRVGRYFTALALLLGLLYALVFLPGNRHTPKLGIDLVGGVRVIFTAKAPQGKVPSSNSMNEARQILADRVNGTGVTQSTVVIQGADQLVVSIPGGTGTDVAKLGQAAVLNFRGLVAPAAAVTCGRAAAATPSGSATASPSANPSATTSVSPSAKVSSPAVSKPTSSSAKPNDVRNRPLAAAPTPKTTPATKPSTLPTSTASGTAPASRTAVPAGSSSAAASRPCLKDPFGQLRKLDTKLTIPTTETAFTALTPTQKQEIAAALANFDCSAAQGERDVASSYFVACDDGRSYGTTVAYLLGSVIVPGRQIADAIAQAPNASQGNTTWSVQLDLKSGGSAAWANWTTKHNSNNASSGSALQCGSATGNPCANYVGFTLDGQVISAPQTQTAINGQPTSITGNFTQTTATDLANKLKFGALPLSFRADSNQRVSATLGTAQLKAALLAGGIGLILVVIYSLLYYRGLGLVTIASLAVSGGLTYAMLVVLAEQIGFTLDLSGIAGFIVALGITADSFVVFFERLKDEVHEGRSIRVAVPRAWVRARRTVLSADTVSFLAAAILYYFASADVKGFAFTLGLSTILDLVVVFLFTHPIVSLLSRSRAFGSKRFTGLDAVRVGGFVSDDAPRGKRAARPAAAGTATERAAQRRGRPVVVLDKPSADEDVTDNDVTDEDVTEKDVADNDVTDAETPDPVVDDTATTDDKTPDRPRKRTAPSGGSAAERAAARRARLREAKADDDGKDGA